MTAALQYTRIHSKDEAEVREPDSVLPRPRPLTSPLVVATDGTVRSDCALRAARAIASKTGQKVLVLTVHLPVPAMAPELQLAPTATMDAEGRKGQLLSVLAQMDRVGITEPWPVKVTSGYPAATIAKLAKSAGASLIVMGLGGHGVLERIFGDEMALQVLRVGSVPILAVAEDFQELPSRALSAVDFSASSQRALELGAPLVRAGGRLILAHVITAENGKPSPSVPDRAHVGSLSRSLDALVTQTAVEENVACDRQVVGGDPVKELLRLAKESDADLIITGSHGHNFLSRLLVGSVSTDLLRKSGKSILIAPPLDAPEFIQELPVAPSRFSFYEWTERLEDFTRRNLWRRARLEVIDPEIGAQVMEDGIPFLGASFEPRDGRVHLMFGDPDVKQHHCHRIEGVTAIQVLRDRGGVELYLRIGHGRGQTLLTLER